MQYVVDFHPDFELEFDALPLVVRRRIYANANALERFGPALRRSRVGTLRGSRHANMKELRFNAADGVWRVAFAFDPTRRGILLVAADKSGVSQRRFYRQLIRKADQRFDDHLDRLTRRRR